MVKAYLRYSLEDSFGVVVSFNGNICLDTSGRFAYVPALESVAIWNLKQSQLVRRLADARSEVTAISSSPDNKHLAAGYSDGTIRIWNVTDGTSVVTFSGHKSAVTALRYNRSGLLLVSGSKDTDVIVWDVVAETGTCRLKGHKDQITECLFLEGRNQVVSSSKDTLLKVWDLEIQHCVQTIVGHRGEVTSLDVNPDETRLVTTTIDEFIRVFEIPPANEVKEGQDPQRTIRLPELRMLGKMRRESMDRVVTLRYHLSGPFLACQTADKTTQIFRVHSPEEAMKKFKRRKKRLREKASSAAEKSSEAEPMETVGEEGEEQGPSVGDELSHCVILRASSKIRSFAFTPNVVRNTRTNTVTIQAVVALHTNTLEIYSITCSSEKKGPAPVCTRVSGIDLPGHRSDVRAIALSSDDTMIASTSNNLLKIWNVKTRAPVRSLSAGYGLCVAFVPGNKQVVVGTKAGTLELYDLPSGTLLESVEAHSAAVWSVCLTPDRKGFVTGSADKSLKFWEFELVLDEEYSKTTKRLTIAHTRTLQLEDDVLSVRISPNGKYIAAALLDSTVKIFFVDTLKFAMSLYGHKLPVLSIDISSDSALVATASADKNVKIWGLDFGDCHKSLRAHEDSVTTVQFIHNTHYMFTASKDGTVKYWDADKFEHVLTLDGHLSEVWCLAISSDGDFLVSGSHDRSLRIWQRTQDQVFLEEERQKQIESLLESGLEQQFGGEPITIKPPTTEGESTNIEVDLDTQAEAESQQVQSGRPGKRTMESLKAGERIMEAADLARHEEEKWDEYKKSLSAAQEMDRVLGVTTNALKKVEPPSVNPLLLGLSASAYLLKTFKEIRSAELEEALLVLPFTVVVALFSYFEQWLLQGLEIDLTCRCMFFLLRIHHNQIVATRTLRTRIVALRDLARRRIKEQKDVIGFNMAALKFIQREIELTSTKIFSDIAAKVALSKAASTSRMGKKRKRSKPRS